jgi:hypothetical protein
LQLLAKKGRWFVRGERCGILSHPRLSHEFTKISYLPEMQ